MPLLTPDLRPVQGECTHLRVFLVGELGPPLDVPELVVAPRLLPGASHAVLFGLQVYSLDLKSLSKHFPEVIRVHVGRDAWEVAHALVLGLGELDLWEIFGAVVLVLVG